MDRYVGTVPDTSEAWCEFYRRVGGLPAVVQPGSGRIVMRAGSVAALTVPADYGGRVSARMMELSQPVGPVIAHLRSRRWSFLVEADVPDNDTCLFMDLFRLDVAVSPPGAEIVLPSPAEVGGAQRVWVRAPHNSFRPSGMSVVRSMGIVPR